MVLYHLQSIFSHSKHIYDKKIYSQISLQHQHCHNAKRLMSNVCPELWPVSFNRILQVSITNYPLISRRSMLLAIACFVVVFLFCLSSRCVWVRFRRTVKTWHLRTRPPPQHSIFPMHSALKWHTYWGIDAAAAVAGANATFLTILQFFWTIVIIFVFFYSLPLALRSIKNRFCFSHCVQLVG